MTDCVSVYNNAVLICKVSEDIASENAKNCRCRQSYSRSTSLPKEPPRMSTQTLYRCKVESLGYIFAADSMGLSSYNFFLVGSERRIFSAIECTSAVQGRPRSIWAPIETMYATSY